MKSTRVRKKELPSVNSSRKFKIILTDNFKAEAKALVKKYPTIKNDYLALSKELRVNPIVGESLGKSIYKIRMAISDKGAGKAGSARVIIHVKIIDHKVYVLSTYDKGAFDNVIKAVLKEMVAKLK